jgi:hypothetical protein
MKYELKPTGFAELEATLARLAIDDAASLARTAVVAGMKVLRSVGVRASKGRIKLEWSSGLNVSGNNCRGSVGLGLGGYRSKVARPHGMYLEEGTQYIAATRFASQALLNAQEKAAAAMTRAAKQRVQYIEQKG